MTDLKSLLSYRFQKTQHTFNEIPDASLKPYEMFHIIEILPEEVSWNLGEVFTLKTNFIEHCCL